MSFDKVQSSLIRLEQAAFDAVEALKIGDLTMAKARMFDVEFWYELAKKDMRKELSK